MSRETILLNEEEYYQKAYGAWLGKNIGGTLGEPVEGIKDLLDLDFYPELPEEGGPLANDDLDLQLIWLHAMEQYGVELGATELGQEWVDHVFYPYNEYGYALANLRRGLEPPVAGWFENEYFNDCMGAPIRSEVWALVAPAAPDVAAAYAYEDAIVDHAGGEGVYGEMFNAALESAAFVEDDPPTLIDVGLAYIPDDCRVANAVEDTVAWHEEGLDWETTRERILEEHGRSEVTDAPQNVAFAILGWLYGEDFGDALLKCVNCGYDTDSSGATLGSLLGILYGKDDIPDEWIEPLGHDVITRDAVRGFPAPGDLSELTDRTQVVARDVQEVQDLPVKLTAEAETQVPDGRVARFEEWHDEFDPRSLWDQDPHMVERKLPAGTQTDGTVTVTVDYGIDGPGVGRGRETDLGIEVHNGAEEAWSGTLDLRVPGGWEGPGAREFALDAGESLAWDVSVRAPEDAGPYTDLHLDVNRTHDGSPWATRTVDIPLVTGTHWRLEGPDGDETSAAFPGRRIAFREAMDGSREGTYRARTTVENPRTRQFRLVTATLAPVTATVNGETVIDGERMLDLRPSSHGHAPDSRVAEFELEEGEHDLEVTVDHDGSDDPLEVYVLAAATGDTEEPGGYYHLIDVQFG